MNYVIAKDRILSQREKPRIFPITLALRMVALVETLILIGTGLVIYWSYLDMSFVLFPHYGLAIAALCVTAVPAFYHSGFYDFQAISQPSRYTYKAIAMLGLIFLIFLSIAFALKISEQFSRVWVFFWFLSAATLIGLERNLIKPLFYRLAQNGQLCRRIIIVGASKQSEKFLQQIKRNNEPWFNVIGIFDDRQSRIHSSFQGFPVLGSLDDALDFFRQNHVDDIIVSLPWKADQRIRNIVEKLKELPVNIRLCPDMAGFMHLNTQYSNLAGMPMLDVVNKPLDGGHYVVKMIEDKILSFLLLVLLSPLMLMIALIIKWDSPGPALFRQKRYGFNNQPFWVFKFRTMRLEHCRGTGGEQARKDDPRVTSIGKFLRKTSLDELPQLINVLQGTMSLVGPRPHPINLDDKFSKIIGGYFSRHRVKPGITGWAQVNGWRGETDTTDKMYNRYKHDVYYIENWSIILDINILIRTAFVVLSRTNAY